MKVRSIVLALVAFFAASTLVTAQQQTGEIYGKATDTSGAVLPGVTVTLTAPNLLQTAGIAMDRENIGGNMSGQQSNYVSRGGNPTNNEWSLDGVDITDLSATGSSPTYYDFDMFDEMTVNTGGVDVTQQTGGVGINLVTKSGSDR